MHTRLHTRLHPPRTTPPLGPSTAAPLSRGGSAMPRRATTLARRALVGAALAVGAALTPSAAHAQFSIPGLPQIVYDPAAVTQLINQVRNSIQMLQSAQRQYQYHVDNLRRLGTLNFRTVNGTLTSIDQVMRTGDAIAYSAATVVDDFDRTFPGAQLSGTMQADMLRQNARTLATIRQTMAAGQATAGQFATSAAALTAMKAQVRTVESFQQANQLNAAVGIHAAEEMTLLRQQLVASANAQHVYMAQQVNRSLQAAAAQERFRAGAAATVVRTGDLRVSTVGVGAP